MPSFVYSRGGLCHFDAKTIRWPGHWGAIQALKKLRLLSVDEAAQVSLVGDRESGSEVQARIVPREFLRSFLEPRLLPKANHRDLCVMEAAIEGTEGGRGMQLTYRLWVEGEPRRNLSAMAKVTAFPAAWAAVAVARGWVSSKGIVAPEDAIDETLYADLKGALSRRGVEIEECVGNYDRKVARAA